LTQASKHQLTSNDQLTQASRQQQQCNFDLVMSGKVLSLASSHPKPKFSSSKSNSKSNWKTNNEKLDLDDIENVGIKN